MTLAAALIWLTVSLVLILTGANALTGGASGLARRMGVSDLVVGLTVVAFGTSAPELIISVTAAAQGAGALALGNVVGSNTLNLLLIVGVTALVRPIAVERGAVRREIPMMVLTSLLLLIFGYSAALNGTGTSTISRTDGLLLLIFFALFMSHTLSTAKSGPKTPQNALLQAKGAELSLHNDAKKTEIPLQGPKEPEIISHGPIIPQGPKEKTKSTLHLACLTVVGLLALLWGGDRFVDAAGALAKYAGLSESVIGLTVVAVGTSLPELAASIAAAVKGKPGIAVGNVVGSNIFNVLLVLGASATVNPLGMDGLRHADLWTLLGASVLFLLFGRFFGHFTITRTEGAVMLAAYAAYTVTLF